MPGGLFKVIHFFTNKKSFVRAKKCMFQCFQSWFSTSKKVIASFPFSRDIIQSLHLPQKITASVLHKNTKVYRNTEKRTFHAKLFEISPIIVTCMYMATCNVCPQAADRRHDRSRDGSALLNGCGNDSDSREPLNVIQASYVFIFQCNTRQF